ncbi:unnamed protein product [Lactuca saligna]|uniref:Uncharacterized protein n=1 Tax=Lactuca saligna TaxID=75948 RepID=A0AA35YQN7_LACSI|nr:unnamed protein product [Lactuca saligna]
MTNAGSQRVASFPVEERLVPGTTNPTMMSMVFKEELMEDSDGIWLMESDYTQADPISLNTSESDYTQADPEHINSNYEPDEDEEETTNSLEISPPLPTLWSYRSRFTNTQVTPRKTTTIPSRKRPASPPASLLPSKKHCSDYSWMPQIRSWKKEDVRLRCLSP